MVILKLEMFLKLIYIIIIIIIIFYLRIFFPQRLLIGFHYSFSDSKSPQVSRTLLSILAILKNDVVWMVSTRPQTSRSYFPFNNPLGTVPKTPFTIGIIVTFMLHCFFNSRARLFHYPSVIFYGQPKQQSLQIFKFSFFLLITLRSGF